MRSLTAKLTLAFLLVGVTGALLVALLVGARTRSEFDRFLSRRDQAVLAEALAGYYAANGGWAGVDAMLAASPPLSFYSRAVTLADADGAVVLGHGPFRPGEVAPATALAEGRPLSAGGAVVGYLLLPSAGYRPAGDERPSPEAEFVERLTWATAVSAGAAALIALLVGGLLARTLARPVRELTAATRALAAGDLGHQVRVRSRDEIGQLAGAFNQMSADLGRAVSARQQMTADLAHDLRTPLSVLRGYTEGLQDGRIAGSPAIFTTMHGEVVHLQRLVDDLRLLSLADAGALTLNRRAVDPAALIERAALAHMVQAEAQGLSLRVEARESLPSVEVDTDRMAQVLNNLVANALAHTPAGGEVTLAAARGADGQVTLAVRDTGAGIAAEDLPRIFHRFYRADTARRRAEEGGSGLGLAIARAIVEAHGGTIAAESTPGHGATFSIKLAAHLT